MLFRSKEMLLVDEVDNKEFLTGLFHAMYDELPAPKPKKKKIGRASCRERVRESSLATNLVFSRVYEEFDNQI